MAATVSTNFRFKGLDRKNRPPINTILRTKKVTLQCQRRFVQYLYYKCIELCTTHERYMLLKMSLLDGGRNCSFPACLFFSSVQYFPLATSPSQTQTNVSVGGIQLHSLESDSRSDEENEDFNASICLYVDDLELEEI